MQAAGNSSSSTQFLGIRQENNNQSHHQISSQLVHQLQSSTAANSSTSTTTSTTVLPQKKRRNQPGTPYPDAEVIALSPKTLMATNRFICEVCNKGFQREQNLQLHRRGHNLPWKLKQKSTKEPAKRKVYLCPEPTCVHHDPSRALGDLTGIKKHYFRKHGEKKWKCEKCSKKYAVQSDWKAHSKTCGTREYRCDCGTLFSRRDSFITHRAFCDALAHESARHPSNLHPLGTPHHLYGSNHHMSLGLSQVVSSQLHQNHNQQTNILSLGNNSNNNIIAPKFEPLISPNLHHHQSPFGVPSPQSPFFNINDPSQQGLIHHHQDLPFSNKQLHGLMQLPDLQANNNTNTNNNNIFNLSFFPNDHHQQFNNINSGGSNNNDNDNSQETTTTTLFGSSGLSDSLFANSLQESSNNMSSHMSATALLQKASQMGSTTTTTNISNNSSSLLRGENHEHHHQHLRGLMNSFANGNANSMFGNNMKGNENNNLGLGGQFHHHDMEEPKKLSQNLSVCFGGSDKLTLDFLGVNGGMMRNMMNSLDPKLDSAQGNQPFGSSTLQ